MKVASNALATSDRLHFSFNTESSRVGMSEILWSDKMLLYSLSNWEIGGPTKEPPLDMQQDSRASRLPVNGLAHFGENRIQRANRYLASRNGDQSLGTSAKLLRVPTCYGLFPPLVICYNSSTDFHAAVGFYLHVCQRSCGLRALPLTQNSDR